MNRKKFCQFWEKADYSTDLLIRDRILPNELFILKIGSVRLQKDVRHWGTFESFKIISIRLKAGQNKRTNQIIYDHKVDF